MRFPFLCGARATVCPTIGATERNYSAVDFAKLFHHFVNFGVLRSAEPYVRT